MSLPGQDVGARAAATEATAVRILDAAAALFGEQMYDHVTLSAVAAGAGVTVQTVIRRFGSKEELFSAVARRRSIALRSARDEAPVGDTIRAVELLLAGYERWGAEILHLLAQERRSPVIAALLDEARRFHRDWVARVFAPLLSRIDPARQQHELAKLVAVTDLYAWKVLRQDTGLSAEDTRAAIREMVEALTRRS
jgi:AcrR family transcriptional regulator